MEAAALRQGSIVDRYTVEDLIGEGGMAMVFRARHNVLGTTHALKVLTLASPQIRARLEREGQLQASLRHPNIVTVTDVIEVGGATALVLELVDGPSLDAVLRARRLTFEEIDLLVPGILAGVAAAHHHGYVHRDLKPANVLLARTEGGLLPKVADFGLAKGAEGSDPGGARTRTGSTMGTPQYMSPEQVRDTKSVGPASDVFALGAILYEMVTGRRAFDGPDLLAIFNAVAGARYTPVAELVPDAPERMVQAIDAALQVDPAARPTVAGLAGLWGADLTAVGSVSMSLPTVSMRSVPRTPETWTSAVPELDAPPAPSVPRVSRAVWALGLGGTLTALALIVAAVAGVGVAVGGWWASGGPAGVPVVVTVPVPVPAPEPPGPAPMDLVPDPAEDPIPEVAAPAGPMHTAPRGERAPAAIPELPAAEPTEEPEPAHEPDQAALEPEPAERPAAGPAESEPIPAAEAPPGPPVLEPFGMLASDDPKERIVAAENLAKRIADPDAPPRLIALVQSDPHPEVRRVAGALAIELYLDAHRDLEPAVVWMMGNGPEGAALGAIDAFRARGADPRKMAGALAHPIAKVRLAALRALPTVAPRAPDGVRVDYGAMLAPLLAEDQPPAVRRLAEDTLARL